MNWIAIVEFIVCIVMGGSGALFLLVALGWFFHIVWLLCFGRRVRATVVGYRNEEEEFYHHHNDVRGHETTSATFHIPVFIFDDEEGQTREVDGMGTMKKRFRIGDQVVMLYSPGNPTRCVVDHFADKWVPALTAFVVGSILSALPAYMLFERL